MDELQKRTPDALRPDADCTDEAAIRRYLAARETWLDDTPEGWAAMQMPDVWEACCWPCLDLLLATRCTGAGVRQLAGLADAAWFGLLRGGRMLMTEDADGFVGMRHRDVAGFAAGVCRWFRAQGVPIDDAPFQRLEPDAAADRLAVLTELLRRMDAVLTREEMERYELYWKGEDEDPLCLDPHLVAEPGGLKDLYVDLDDGDARRNYLAYGYFNAAFDGYLTQEQASAADAAGKALLREVGLSEEDAARLVEWNGQINRLNRLANAEGDNPVKRSVDRLFGIRCDLPLDMPAEPPGDGAALPEPPKKE